MRQRVQRVKVHPRYDRKPCGDVSETESCNTQDCNVDCKLGHWKAGSACSKACNGGTKYSKRTVKVAAVGQGKCPAPKSSSRMERLAGNKHQCPTSRNQALKCKSKLDLVLLLDGIGSIKAAGWDKTKAFASSSEAFDGMQRCRTTARLDKPRVAMYRLSCSGR